MSHIVYYDYIAFFVQLFLFPGVNNCHGFFFFFFYLLGFSVIVFLCIFWWIWQMALNVKFQMLKFLRHLSHLFVFSYLSCGSYPDLLSFVSSLGPLQSCCLGIPLRLSFSLLGIDWPPYVWRSSSAVSVGRRQSKPFTLKTEDVRCSVLQSLLQPEFRRRNKSQWIRWALHNLKRWGLWGTLWKHDSGRKVTTFLAPPPRAFSTVSEPWSLQQWYPH